MNTEWPVRSFPKVGDLLEWLEQEPEGYMYRGQTCGHLPLYASLGRNVCCFRYKARLEEERKYIDFFRKHAERFLGPNERQLVKENPQGERVACMIVMQHYGAPTRLLDWTLSRRIAAFFACIDSCAKDAAIWWVRQQKISESVDPLWPKNKFERRTEEAGGEVILDSGIFRTDVDPFVSLVTLPTFPFKRLKRQRSCFTIGTRLDIDHEAMLGEQLKEQIDANDWGKVVVPFRWKPQVMQYLEGIKHDAVSLQHTGADRVGFKMSLERERRAHRSQRFHDLVLAILRPK